MIDMHAHWRPAELIDALRTRTKEPRIVRNQDGVEVLKSRIGEEPLSRAFDDVEFHLARMDRQGVSTSALSLLGSFCWIESQPVEVSLPLCRMVNDALSGLCQKYEGRFNAFVALPLADMSAAAAEFERALALPGVVGAQVPGNGFLTKKDAENMRPLLEVANRHRAIVFIHHGPLPGDKFPKVAGDTDNARRRNGTLDMQASLSSVMVTLCLTDYLAPYPDATVLVHNLGGNIPYEIERMDHRSLLDSATENCRRRAFRRAKGVRGLQLVWPGRDRGRGALVRRRAHRVRHRRNRIRLRVDQQGACGCADRRGCAREDFTAQCHSDDVAARKGRAARNRRRVILARAKNGGNPGRMFYF
jgi:predicted TIM-barrel fold metal-dependent hydrolase